jgi:hypothetical protein
MGDGSINSHATPAAARMLADIETILTFGVRQPGSEGDGRAESWALEQFVAIGLVDVRAEPVDLTTWEYGDASLAVWDAGTPNAAAEVYAGFALPYSVGCEGLERDLVLFDAASGAEAVAGQIAVEPLTFLDLAQSVLREGATSVWDPEGEFDSLVQTLPFGARMNLVLDAAVEAGAAGYVGLLTGVPWETADYYVPYDTKDRSISGLWLSRSSGERLRRRLDAGPVRGRLDVRSARRQGRSHNIVGHLPGAGDETIIIGSHHDAPWASAVEDASGMAMVLAQARYWASVPEADRPHNLTFLLNAGHMAGGSGAQAFVAAHAPELTSVVLEVHLEHAAGEVRGDGTRLELTGEPEPRWWFTSQDAQLEAAVADALQTEDLRRSFVLPPTIFGEAPTTDGAAFHLAGVPIVHFLTAPMYLFDSQDTVDKVHVPSLEPVMRAVIRIVDSMAGRTAAGLRGGIRS